MSRRKRKVSINNIIYGHPIQANPFVKLPNIAKHPLEKSIRLGLYFVVAAGNYGPMPGTINPFAKVDKAIVVGGAKNDGSDLCSFSSRGIPGVPFSGPTIVCPCENLIGKTHSGIIPIRDEQNALKQFMTRERYGYQVYRKVEDSEWDYVRKNFVVGTGTSQAVEYLVSIIACIINFRNKREFVSDQRVIRSILTDMAQPIKNYKNFEVGAGFVDFRIADQYLIDIDNGKIPKGQKDFWSWKYHLPAAKNGETHIKWFDNVNSPNQIYLEEDLEDGDADFSI